MNSYGFIITRHVNSVETNKYWNHCIKCIRRFYPFKKIIVIDDNSDANFLKAEFNYRNVKVIQSEFKGRGELLPYYYYLKNKFFDNAVIIHDSVFFHKRLHFEKLIGTNVLPLWFFYPDKENVSNTLRIANSLKYSEIIKSKIMRDDTVLEMPHSKWYGCFGAQSFINFNFLNSLESKYKITNMLTTISCRADRCSLERILGCIFFTESPTILTKKSIFGDIMKYHKWGYSFNNYENDLKKGRVPRAVLKIWTGR
jgi:hypothetical protein